MRSRNRVSSEKLVSRSGNVLGLLAVRLWYQFKSLTMPRSKKAEVTLVEGQNTPDVQSFSHCNQNRVYEIDLSVRILEHNGRGATIVGISRSDKRIAWLGQVRHEPGQGFRAEIAPDEIGQLDGYRCRQKGDCVQSLGGLPHDLV